MDIPNGASASDDGLTERLARLQALASQFRPIPLEHEHILSLRVAHISGASAPWGLLETVETGRTRSSRMLCFETAALIECALQERLTWQIADQHLLDKSEINDFMAVTFDWERTSDVKLRLESERHALRREICITKSTRVFKTSRSDPYGQSATVSGIQGRRRRAP